MKIYIYTASELTVFFLLMLNLSAKSQKLPNIQSKNIWAPANVKIDGKATEWDNEFRAYNNATEIFYTITNDDKNIYLAVQAKDQDIINKIVNGGITFSIEKPNEKKNKRIINITYPIKDKKTFLVFNLNNKTNKLDTSSKDAEIIMFNNNAQLTQKCKWIGVSGIVGLDSLISVYNESGILAAGLFDTKKVYTLELSVSLKYLSFLTNDNTNFSYYIRVNGWRAMSTLKIAAGENSTPEQLADIEKLKERANALSVRLSAPTDFSGEYTLAKKP